MTNEQEQNLKAMAADCGYNSTQVQTGKIGGYMAQEDCEPARPSLGERVANQLGKARRESRKESRLAELSYLLEKNPEVARILDLIEDVRG